MTPPPQPPAPGRPRTLAEAFRQLDAAALAALLTARPDLATPPPTDLADLAARSTTQPSVARAVGELDAWQLGVLEAVVTIGDGCDATAAAALLGGADVTPASEAIERLRGGALIWEGPDGLSVPRAVREAFGGWPGGLAPASDRPLAAEQIAAALASCSAAVTPVLERLVWGPPRGTVRDADTLTTSQARTPVAELVQAGLLRVVDRDAVLLPREVALHLRHGLLHRQPPTPEPPALPRGRRPLALVTRAGVGAAWEFVRSVDVALDEIAQRRPQPLRTGQPPKRELATIARLLTDTDPEQGRTHLVLAVATAAGLLSHDGHLMAPTRAYDSWLTQPPPVQWTQLVTAWLEDGAASAVRRELLAAPAGTAVTGEALAARVRWRHPRRTNDLLDNEAAACVQEAGWLGVLSLGQRTQLDASALPPTVAAEFPQPLDRFVIESDLTAIGHGPLDHATRGVLRLMASQESHGGADVFRFSARSLQPAFNQGWSAHSITGWLARHSLTGVPQPLAYLLDDLGRRHGSVRVSTVTTLVRADDPSDTAQAVRHPEASALGLREVAPGVLVATADPDEVVALLRTVGLTPAAEDESGALVQAPPTVRLPTPPAPPVPPPVDVDALATRLLTPPPATDSAQLLALLNAAIADGFPVDLQFVGPDGTTRREVARPQHVSAGGVRVLIAGQPHFVPLSRVVGAWRARTMA